MMTELPIAERNKIKEDEKRTALFIKIEESLNLRNPKIKDAPRYLKKQTTERNSFK